MNEPGSTSAFDVWNPDTWTDETANIEPEVEPSDAPTISTHNELVNLVHHGHFTGMDGVKAVIDCLIQLKRKYALENRNQDAMLGEDEVRRAVLTKMNCRAETYRVLFTTALDAYRKSDADGFIRSANGNIIPNLHNATLALANHPQFGKRFVYNEFSYLVEDKTTGLTVSNEVILQTTIAIQKMQGCNFDKRLIIDAINVVAATNRRYHPIKDYFATLTWDGIDRLSKAGATYWGTKTHIENIFMHKWLISAIARVLEPGCQVDTMIVLEGKQGIGKSSSLRLLVPDPRYFLDHLPTPGDREAPIHMAGRWIVEMSELAAIKGAKNIEKIKAFLTHRIDTYRLFGVGTLANNPRNCVFAGTTNSSQYLQDDTGNRRTWPVYCHSIDTKAIAVDRDQLWAQALHEYTVGKTTNIDYLYHLSPEEERIHAPLALDKVESDITIDLLKQWLAGYRYIAGAGMTLDEDPAVAKMRQAGVVRDKFTALEASIGIGIEGNKVTRAQEMAIGRGLRILGYVSKTVSVNGAKTRKWVKE